MLQLNARDRQMLSGQCGEAAQFAMQMLVSVGEPRGATRLIDIAWAHVASAYYQGQVNLDFARRLAAGNARVAVPTTLTACSIDMGAPPTGLTDDDAQRELIETYRAMGCEPVMTCAPYDAREEPKLGEHLAWTESSAVVYANSVLGARSNRYVEFIDMCAAITGRVPDCGLHNTEARQATALFELGEMPAGWYDDDWFFHALGILVGQQCGADLPAIDGLASETTSGQLRALGSAAASSGSVDMFHAIGVTPEAGTLADAFQQKEPHRRIDVSANAIRETAASLGAHPDTPVTAVCIGAPHASLADLEALHDLLAGREVAGGVRVYVATSAAVAGQLETAGLLSDILRAGVDLVIGRCTYYRPAMPGTQGHVVTNSAKWAYYAPSALGAKVTFATLADCVDSACAGRAVLRESQAR